MDLPCSHHRTTRDKGSTRSAPSTPMARTPASVSNHQSRAGNLADLRSSSCSGMTSAVGYDEALAGQFPDQTQDVFAQDFG